MILGRSVGKKSQKQKEWRGRLELGGLVPQQKYLRRLQSQHMATLGEGKVDVVVKLKRGQRKKDDKTFTVLHAD